MSVRNAVSLLLAAVLVADLAILVRQWQYRRTLAEVVREAVVREWPRGRQFDRLIGGYGADGVWRATGETSSGPIVVRYAAASCGYCQRDTLWESFAEAMVAAGWNVVVVLPSAEEAYGDGELLPQGAAELAFVETGWAGHLRLTRTPTVLMFSEDGELVWSHQGMLAPDNVAAARHAVSSGG